MLPLNYGHQLLTNEDIINEYVDDNYDFDSDQSPHEMVTIDELCIGRIKDIRRDHTDDNEHWSHFALDGDFFIDDGYIGELVRVYEGSGEVIQLWTNA